MNTEAHPALGVAELHRPTVLLATGLGTGFLPTAPGTWGSLLGALLWWLFVGKLSLAFALGLCVVLFVLGILAIRSMQRRYRVLDAPEIVIDEIVGLWVALLAAPFVWWALVIGFLAFRLFDIYKPWPVSWADRQHTALGVMLDDVLAGCLALVVVQVAVFAVQQLGGL